MIIANRVRATKPRERYAEEHARANLARSALEAAAWGTKHADALRPATCLRSDGLRPYAFNDSRHDSLYDVGHARHVQLHGTDHLGGVLSRDNRELIELSETALADAVEPFFAGRLLVWHRDITIDDSVGEGETQGYLDYSDMPPWDTWVAYCDTEEPSGYLVSWVPPVFVKSVQRAIDANAYEALYWLRGSDRHVVSAFTELGLLA